MGLLVDVWTLLIGTHRIKSKRKKWENESHVCCVCPLEYSERNGRKEEEEENPTTNGGVQNGSSVEIYYTLHTRFCTFGADLHAQPVLVNKIFASELSQKFIKTALLVGEEEGEEDKDKSSGCAVTEWVEVV